MQSLSLTTLLSFLSHVVRIDSLYNFIPYCQYQTLLCSVILLLLPPLFPSINGDIASKQSNLLIVVVVVILFTPSFCHCSSHQHY
jgi:hypothetical protein